jgi:hypothetical protein
VRRDRWCPLSAGQPLDHHTDGAVLISSGFHLDHVWTRPDQRKPAPHLTKVGPSASNLMSSALLRVTTTAPEHRFASLGGGPGHPEAWLGLASRGRLVRVVHGRRSAQMGRRPAELNAQPVKTR